jgi:hypothetical protein
MKKTLLSILLVISVHLSEAQTKYEKLWTEVEALELEGKYKSADAIVEKIFKKANLC